MSVIASVAVPASEFPLGSLLEGDSEARVSVETTVPTSEEVIPYLWVPNGVIGGVLDALQSITSLDSTEIVDEVDSYTLVRLEWRDSVNGLLASIRDASAIVTGAVGTADQWTFRLRLPSYEELSSFYATCVDRDISIELVQLHEAISSETTPRFGLTEAQRELVLAAYENGYFDVPRKTTLVELGDRLEVSDSAVSQRLRRGLASLIHSTIVIDGKPYDTEPPK
ncbi:helix-turn-helix domain-containing protein [Natronoglomus mannanivorans]|uniref:Helix-turn-helix domain-containing protein n=1 Tax=Natronoglomus mannanivorans TaxID=2979990 RepID=A0AAP3E2Q8_9EURY|nr:helix-turn-helix domain-containing protein [Halobacteria archaeon AArc-xg1-1]